MANKRRQRSDTAPLGATEFAAALNGDDPNAIYRCLKQFVRSVRRERDKALGLNASSQESSSSSDDEEETVIHANKKLKKDEAWKQDTAEYNVPFVGTAVSTSAKDVGTVVPGEWPTGLLQAYLLKSPLAVELTGDELIPAINKNNIHKSLLKQNNGALSRAIHKYYLLTLRDLVTAAIPFAVLRQQQLQADDEQIVYSKTTESPRFLSELIKLRLPALLSLLRDETANGKGATGVEGGCGPLASIALELLAAICQTSTPNARHVIRSLVEHTPESVLFFLLKPQRGNNINETTSSSSKAAVARDDARAAALRLTAILVGQHDPAVFSCISSPGVKDRKIKPGLAYVALKEGLTGLRDHGNDDVLLSASSLLRAMFKLITDNTLPRRLIYELMSRDFVQNLCHLTEQAPNNNHAFQNALDRTNDDHGTNAKEQLYIAARGLLFTLLMDPTKSPLLYALATDDKSAKNSEQVLVRAMIALLETHAGLDVQTFLVGCTTTTPRLQRALFQALSFPDSNKHVFLFCKRLNFVARMIRNGPSSLDLNDAEGANDATHIFPTGFRKQLISKALRSSNPFLVSETLKFLIQVLNRFEADLEKVSNPETKEGLRHSFCTCLPDLLSVLNLFTRFDMSVSKANAVVTGYACDLIRALRRVASQTLLDTNFEWIKLLPKDASVFCKAPLSLQTKIISLLVAVTESNSPYFSIHACKLLIEIAMLTKSAAVHVDSRKLAILCVSSAFPTVANELPGEGTWQSINYEIECWVDGMTNSILGDFSTALQESSQHTVRTGVIFAKAWKNSSLPGAAPKLNVSPVLVHALQTLPSASQGLASLICQVAARCLLTHHSPLPIATIIAMPYESRECEKSFPPQFICLAEYAKSLVAFSSVEPPDRVVLLLDMLRACFSKESAIRQIAFQAEKKGPDPEELTLCDQAMPLLQQVAHLVIIAESSDNLIKVFQKLLPLALKTRNDNIDSVLDRAVSKLNTRSAVNLVDFVVLSSASNELSGTLLVKALNIGKSLTADLGNAQCRMNLLYLYLVAPFVPNNIRMRISSDLLKLYGSTTVTVPVPKLLEATLLKYLDSFTSAFESDVQSIDKFINLVVQTWLALAGMGPAKQPIVKCLEQIIRSNLSALSPPIVSCHFASVVQRYEAHALIEKCLATNAQYEKQNNFLAELLECNNCRYASAFAEALSNGDLGIEKVLDSGSLDSALLRLVENEAILGKYPGTVDVLLKYTAQKLITILPSSRPVPEMEALLHLFLKLFNESCQSLSTKVYKSLLFTANAALNDSSTDPTFMLKVTLPLSIGLAKHPPEESVLDLSDLKFRLQRIPLEILPNVLGSFSATDNEATRANLVYTLEVIEKVLAMCKLWDVRLVSGESAAILKHALLSCASFALEPSEKCWNKEQISVLKSLHLVLKASLLLASQLALTPNVYSEVLSMILTHLNLQDFFATTARSVESPEMVKQAYMHHVLNLCFSNTDTTYDSKVGQILLSSYNAGMSTIDRLCRRTVFRYLSLAPPDTVTMDTLRWKEARSASLDNGSFVDDWSWLPDSIDIQRMQSTIRDFPFDDKFDPFVRDTEAMLGDSELVVDAFDRRYSPGFLLPLILGALDDNGHPAKQNVHLSHQLCDKGVLSLALASLSSNCFMIRKLTAAVLGRFINTIDSDEARSIASWRDRPQILMLLKATNRGLTIRKAADEWSKGEISRLPGVSAIFLARACMVLARPGDSVYPAINRYFLRTEAEHGAFQDIYRLPAFIALICSSSDEPDQALKERSWALRLLHDGFQDAECYGPVAKCHALELVFSCIHDARLFSSNGQEVTTALTTLTKIVQKGGDRALSHLFERLGLFPWLRSLLVGEDILSILPDIDSRLAFVDLIQASVENALRRYSSDELGTDAVCLIQPLLDLCNSSANETSVSPKRWSLQHLVERICSVVKLLGSNEVAAATTERRTIYHNRGICLSSAVNFLDMIADDSLKCMALVGICALPVQSMTGDTSSETGRFCCLALDVIKLEEQPDVTVLITIMRRVADLLAESRQQPLIDSGVILQLFAIRAVCMRRSETESVWTDCLKQVKSSQHLSSLDERLETIIDGLLL